MLRKRPSAAMPRPEAKAYLVSGIKKYLTAHMAPKFDANLRFEALKLKLALAYEWQMKPAKPSKR